MSRALYFILALFFAVLCLAPLGLSAQESGSSAEENRLLKAGRSIALVSLSGSKASKIEEDVFAAFGDGEHTFSSPNLFAGALEDAGLDSNAFLLDSAQLMRFAETEKIDAILVTSLSRDGKIYELHMEIYDGATGAIMGEYRVELGRKRRVTQEAAQALAEGLSPLLEQTGWALKQFRERPVLVNFSVTSDPSGAQVLSTDGEVLGITPMEIQRPVSEHNGPWRLVHPEAAAPQSIEINGAEGGSYAVTFERPTPPPVAPATALFPLLEVSVGAQFASRSLDVTVEEGTSLKTDSGTYPVTHIEVVSFPFSNMAGDALWGGLGFGASFGLGGFKSILPYDINRAPLPADSTCGTPTREVMECSTQHLDWSVGAEWRMLLQEDTTQSGRLDPNGMRLGVEVAYTDLMIDIDANSKYEGHGYQGLLLGASFLSPLGLPELKGGVSLAFTPFFTYGDGDMIADWGLTASAWGARGGASLSYEVYEGISLIVDYEMRYQSTSYEGTICDNPVCDGIRRGSEATDTLQLIGVKLGYRLD